MGGTNRCAVSGCGNDRRYKHKLIIKDHVPEFKFHFCPPKWRSLWLKLINRKDLASISDHTRICSNHFVLGKPIGIQPHPSLYMRGYSDNDRHSDNAEIQRISSSWSADDDESSCLTAGHGKVKRKSAEDVPTKERRTGLEDEASSQSPGPSEEATSRTPVCPGSGKPAYEMHESDPDWVPSLQMGHGEGSSRRPERLPSETAETQRDKQRWRTEARPSCVSSCPPAVRPWRDVRPLLLSALQRPMDTGGRPGDETQQQTAAVSENAGFRDFFRDALEASLETSSRSRALRQTPVSVERDVELTFQSKASSSSSSSSSCLNCVRLQRRIRELQDQLSQDTEASPASNKTLLQPNQDLQGRKTVLKEPGRGGDFASTSTPSGAAVSEDDPAGQRPRRPPRFQWAWLKMFWFLRYSPTLDEMWCHVCRLHANKYFQNSALAKGSRRFRVHNIKKHSHSNYHKENVQRHLLAESRNAPL
ncbi:uncharacterized protein [Chaetodon trifascialis]|uniref:uncharacterized protein isoform X1 n=1 Tax=Chaetodon trifascialis TaxID=109706 RepID=UPI003994E418